MDTDPSQKRYNLVEEYLRHSDNPNTTLGVIIKPAYAESGKTPDIAKTLGNYGTIDAHFCGRHVLSLKPFDTESLQRLESDFYAGNIEGILDMCVEPESVSTFGVPSEEYFSQLTGMSSR